MRPTNAAELWVGDTAFILRLLSPTASQEPEEGPVPSGPEARESLCFIEQLGTLSSAHLMRRDEAFASFGNSLCSFWFWLICSSCFSCQALKKILEMVPFSPLSPPPLKLYRPSSDANVISLV